MQTALDDEIRAKTEAFVSAVAGLIRRAAIEAVQLALGTMHEEQLKRRSAANPAPLAVRSQKVTDAPETTAKRPVHSKRSFGAKRPPAELAALVEKVGGFIQANPGLGAEAISKAIGKPSRELSVPFTKLLAAKRVRSEGVKNMTRYFPV